MFVGSVVCVLLDFKLRSSFHKDGRREVVNWWAVRITQGEMCDTGWEAFQCLLESVSENEMG